MPAGATPDRTIPTANRCVRIGGTIIHGTPSVRMMGCRTECAAKARHEAVSQLSRKWRPRTHPSATLALFVLDLERRKRRSHVPGLDCVAACIEAQPKAACRLC